MKMKNTSSKATAPLYLIQQLMSRVNVGDGECKAHKYNGKPWLELETIGFDLIDREKFA